MDNNVVTIKVGLPKSFFEEGDEWVIPFMKKIYQQAKDELSKKDLEEIGAVAISTFVCTRVMYQVTKDKALKDVLDVLKTTVRTGSQKDFNIELNFK